MEHKGDDAIAAYKRLQREYQSGLEAKIDVAKERFSLFLQGTKTHMKGTLRDGSGDAIMPTHPNRFVAAIKSLWSRFRVVQ